MKLSSRGFDQALVLIGIPVNSRWYRVVAECQKGCIRLVVNVVFFNCFDHANIPGLDQVIILHVLHKEEPIILFAHRMHNTLIKEYYTGDVGFCQLLSHFLSLSEYHLCNSFDIVSIGHDCLYLFVSQTKILSKLKLVIKIVVNESKTKWVTFTINLYLLLKMFLIHGFLLTFWPSHRFSSSFS